MKPNGSPVPSIRWGSYLTVLQVFATIDSALAGGADDVSVLYDEQFGYPRDVLIDYAERVGVDDQGFSISELSILPE